MWSGMAAAKGCNPNTCQPFMGFLHLVVHAARIPRPIDVQWVIVYAIKRLNSLYSEGPQLVMCGFKRCLNILTIRSLKERYHVDSDTDESVSTMLTNNDDLESFVRDFAIDDSISDCFADESDEPSCTLQFPKTSKSYVSDSDLASARPLRSATTVSNKSYNAANSLPQRRQRTEDGQDRKNKSTTHKSKEVQPSPMALIAQQKPLFVADAFDCGTKTALKGQRLSEHSEKRTAVQDVTQDENLAHCSINLFIPVESSSSKSTEVSAKVDKASKVCKHSKFGLKQVWSNTLKKCITKKNSLQDDDEDSLCYNDIQPNVKNKYTMQKSCSSGLNSEYFEDFDELFSSRLNAQLQAKSEPDLGSSNASAVNGMNENVLDKKTEGLFLTNKFEEVNTDILSDADKKQAACPHCVISKDGTKIHSESMADSCEKNSLKRNVPSATFASLINGKPDCTISDHQMDSGSTSQVKCQDIDTNNNISPDLKIGLLDKINEALFQRTLFTLVKQTRCSSLLSDLLEKFINSRVIETLSAAIDQLKQLLFMSNRSHDVSRIVEMIHKNLQNTLSQLNQLRESMENLKIEMPFARFPTDDGPTEDKLQPRSLLTDTYNIVKNQPPDLNDKIQDLISFHLKSRLLSLTNGQSFFREPLISENKDIRLEDHKLRMALNSNDRCPLVKVSDSDAGDSLPDLSSDAQTVISNKSYDPKLRPQYCRHIGIGQMHHSGSKTVSSHFPYSGASDRLTEKVTSSLAGQIYSNGQCHCKSVRSSDCKCHPTCRHGRRSAERRQDHCKHRNRDARRYRSKGRRSASDSRYSRRRNTISSFTTSSANTLSTATSTQSVDRHSHYRRHKSSRTFRSSSSSSRQRNHYDADEYWSDNESDDDDEEDEDDDDDESYTPLVRLNVDNEDLPHEALRIDRLHRHLESVKKLHQSSEDIIETIITGTGEKLIPNDLFVPEPTSTVAMDSSNHPEQSSRPPKLQYDSQKPMRMNVFKSRRLAVAQMFNHEKALLGNMRELTDSEFEETFDRRHDVSVKRRQQMDSEIPWDQLSFSKSVWLQTFTENILTIRSLKERYHVDSDTDESVSTMLTNNDDLESFVRDFAIDDSISDCFADESDEPSCTLQFSKTSKSYVSDSDPPSARPLRSATTVSNKSYNAANSLPQRRQRTEDGQDRRNKSTTHKSKEVQPSPMALIAQQKPLFVADALDCGTKTVLKGQHLSEHSEKRTAVQDVTQDENLAHCSINLFIPVESSSSKSTEVSAKVDKASKVYKHSKFGLKQVWSNTLKKCITKKNSLQDDDEDSLCYNDIQPNVKNKYTMQKSCSSGLNSEYFEDFDELFSSRLNAQLQAKSEPDISSSNASAVNGMNENVLDKKTEGLFLTNKFEEVNTDILSDADKKQAACPHCVISKDSTKIHSESMAEKTNFKSADSCEKNSLKRNVPSATFASPHQWQA
ncbi:hypothetical protein Btru_043968 [Bulinus truncatus]|nr:hypothetical protein Btru_043968 [Bulinus truncatus]